MSPSRIWRHTLAAILALSFALVVTASCASESTAPSSPSPERASATASAIATSPRATSTAGTTVPTGLTPATVTRVVDGDTIRVEIGGEEFRVRYIGIDTPETVDPRQPVECFGEEAGERNRQLVDGKVVGLEKDVSETDSFGRLLRYVWIGDEMVNAMLVAEGYALASTYPPDVKHSELFASLQAQARDKNRGLWGAACNSATPSPAAVGPCAYSGTAESVIKGNISVRTGEKIYHVPGGEFYDATVIDAFKGERYFCTEADAVASGWRKSLR